ncbi:hypothetical protein CDL15_Pgr024205 [Punica granatum]|uniref:Uncharacterized protein n=1 Tax=Punica granatum TaxID=22663 RepID=A0A218XWM5_PUNGR|nr:hypothetical protein CDL15_Pgr024205 [Punica granatum]
MTALKPHNLQIKVLKPESQIAIEVLQLEPKIPKFKEQKPKNLKTCSCLLKILPVMDNLTCRGVGKQDWSEMHGRKESSRT